MLETIHELAREELKESGELYPLLAAELDNFRAALRWMETSQNRELVLRMMSALWRMWQQTGNDNEAARTALGEERFQKARETGRDMSFEEGISFARS